MSITKTSPKRQQGAALIVALVLLAIMLLLGATISSITANQEKLTAAAYERSLAKQRSESNHLLTIGFARSIAKREAPYDPSRDAYCWNEGSSTPYDCPTTGTTPPPWVRRVDIQKWDAPCEYGQRKFNPPAAEETTQQCRKLRMVTIYTPGATDPGTGSYAIEHIAEWIAVE